MGLSGPVVDLEFMGLIPSVDVFFLLWLLFPRFYFYDSQRYRRTPFNSFECLIFGRKVIRCWPGDLLVRSEQKGSQL